MTLATVAYKELSSTQKILEARNTPPTAPILRKTLVLNAIPGLESGTQRISQPNILVNEKHDPIRLPDNFPPNCILVVGDLSNSSEAKWFRRTSPDNANKSHQLHLGLLKEEFSSIPEDDQNVLVVESIPINQRAGLQPDIKAGKIGLISNSRLEELKRTLRSGQTLVDLLAKASIAPDELKISTN